MSDSHDCLLPDSKMLEKNAMNHECVRKDGKKFHRGKCKINVLIRKTKVSKIM